jgi:7-cyano-7-deazaguanine reductase
MRKTKKSFNGLTLLRRSQQAYPTAPDTARLEVFPNPEPKRDYLIRFDCPEFTSICPVTGQPDFGHIVLDYVPNKLCIESKSLKLHLFSYRNHGAFAETIVNGILDAVLKACKPRRATVTGDFTARGGIALRVTASFPQASEFRS